VPRWRQSQVRSRSREKKRYINPPTLASAARKHARGTEHGAFHDFLKHVFEYATGLDAEDHSSLSTWMKTLAGLLRQEDEISDRLIAAEVELETLEIEPGAVSSRREDLEQQIAVARDDLNLLRSKIKEARPGKKSGKQ
jgi:hypothetical protein